MIFQNELNILKTKIIKLFLIQLIVLIAVMVIFKLTNNQSLTPGAILGLTYDDKSLPVELFLYGLNWSFAIISSLYIFMESFKLGIQNLFLRGSLKKWIIVKTILIIGYVFIYKCIFYIIISFIGNINYLNFQMFLYYPTDILLSLIFIFISLLVLTFLKSYTTSIVIICMLFLVILIFPITVVSLKTYLYILLLSLLILVGLFYRIFKKRYYNIYEKI
ncbi:MAG: hypothetical protein PHI05_01695 [Bacilli bacterium]|nr:hypothetical protein [Bacilli bacterium]MDD4547441.1 hypothetical protein [Bacilli bacterium]